jgi:hypothetical protein
MRSIAYTTLSCPIRTLPDQRLFGTLPTCFAAYRVLHRLLLPRYPPIALLLEFAYPPKYEIFGGYISGCHVPQKVHGVPRTIKVHGI